MLTDGRSLEDMCRIVDPHGLPGVKLEVRQSKHVGEVPAWMRNGNSSAEEGGWGGWGGGTRTVP